MHPELEKYARRLRQRSSDGLDDARALANGRNLGEGPTPEPEDYGSDSGRTDYETTVHDDHMQGEARFKLIPFAEIRPNTKPRHLIKGIFPVGGLIVVWGPPKCGKSFWVLDSLMHVVLNGEYRGRRVQQGTVVYLALEGGEAFKDRKEAWRIRHNVDEAPFYLVTERASLVKDHKALIKAIKDQLGEDAAPAVVCIDTLNRSIDGSESSDEDMTAYVQAADAIREAFHCAVIIVHHCGIDGTRPRGHTSLTGAVDAQLRVQRDSANNIVVTVEWMKDGPEGDVIVSRLDVVELGKDDQGDPLTSCVIVPAEPSPAKPIKVKAKAWPKSASTAMRALRKALDDLGTVPPASNTIPPNARTVTIAGWRKYAYAMGISTGQERAQQKAFENGSEWLIGAGHAVVWNDQAWLGESPSSASNKRTNANPL